MQGCFPQWLLAASLAPELFATRNQVLRAHQTRRIPFRDDFYML